MSSQPADCLTRARAGLASFPFWRGLPPAKQEAHVMELARCYALFDSAIGQAAAEVSRRAESLAAAFHRFIAAFPNRRAAEAAGQAALAAAGLAPDPRRLYGCDHFADTPKTFRHLLYALELMFPPLHHCDPPDPADGVPYTHSEEDGTDSGMIAVAVVNGELTPDA